MVSDCQGCILDISIMYGGASADCLAFEASDLHKRLENGLMKKLEIKRGFSYLVIMRTSTLHIWQLLFQMFQGMKI